MLEQESIKTIVQAAKEAADPKKSLVSYTKTLLLASLDAVGYDPEELAYREGVNSCIESIVRSKNPDILVLDLPSILYLPEIVGDPTSSTRCVFIDCVPGIKQAGSALEDLDQLIKAGLKGISDKYEGVATSLESVQAIVGNRRAFQLRTMLGDGPLTPSFDYRMEYDEVWRTMVHGDMPGAGLLVWNYGKCNEVGYNGDVLMPYENPLPLFPHLRSVIQLPEAMESWLFCWSTESNNCVDMIDLTDDSQYLELFKNGISEAHRDMSISVSDIAIAVNRNLCPKYYSDGKAVEVQTTALSEISTKIQRGTGLTGKDLDIIGTIYKLDPGKSREESEFVSLSGLGGPAPIGLKKGTFILRKKDCWYIDNSCIQDGGFVEPKLIASIPDGQDRYTIKPEDGLCLLIPRNGKGISPFVAKAPTLVSDNLIIVRVNPEVIDEGYLSCIARSVLVFEQIRNSKKPLTKDAVGSILLPILDQEAQQAVISRDTRIRNEIIDLHNRIVMLEMEDSFDVLESLGLEGDRRAWKKQHDSIEGGNNE